MIYSTLPTPHYITVYALFYLADMPVYLAMNKYIYELYIYIKLIF